VILPKKPDRIDTRSIETHEYEVEEILRQHQPYEPQTPLPVPRPSALAMYYPGQFALHRAVDYVNPIPYDEISTLPWPLDANDMADFSHLANMALGCILKIAVWADKADTWVDIMDAFMRYVKVLGWAKCKEIIEKHCIARDMVAGGYGDLG
jgi:hypothetical protein